MQVGLKYRAQETNAGCRDAGAARVAQAEEARCRVLVALSFMSDAKNRAVASPIRNANMANPCT